MSATVLRVEPYNKGDKKNAYVFLSDAGGEQKAWCPDQERALALVVGQPLPEDWELKPSDYGPQVFPPRPAGGGAKTAFRNTKEGFLLEQQGYERKEERSMRRTALMQAVAAIPTEDGGAILTVAEYFYNWLSKSPVSANPAAPAAGGVPGSPPSPPAKSSGPPSRSHGEPPTGAVAGGSDPLSAPRSGSAGASASAVAPMGARTMEDRAGQIGPGVGADTSSTDALLAEGALPVVGGVGGRPDEGGQEAGATGEGRDGADGPPCPKCGFHSAPSPNLKGWRVCLKTVCGNAWKSGVPVAT